MKLNLLDENNMIFYLNIDYLNKTKFDFKEHIEQNFKDLFIKLKNIYNLNLSGYYEVVIYVNDIYGMIIELEKDDDEYIKIFGDTLDMKITFKLNCELLYEIESYYPFKFKNYKLYYNDNKFYINIDKLDKDERLEYLKLLENSTIIYGKEISEIMGKVIKIC